MFENKAMIDVLADVVDEGRLHFHMSNIFESDRLSTFTAYNHTALWIKNQLLAYGLDEVELQDIPADGKNLVNDWICPLAWDVSQASLDVESADGAIQRVCDYEKMPDSVVHGSCSSKAGGERALLVDIDNLDLSKDRIEGCIALTSQKACDVKRLVYDAGGVGVVSFFHPFPDEDMDSIFWYNCWSDRVGGWWQTAKDCRLFGFSISPNQGALLRKRLEMGEAVAAIAQVDTEIYEGSLPFVTGKIEGTESPDEEILVLSHLYEHGAHDNATGSSTNLEIARALMSGIQSGKIERPKRSLRFLFMAECYGTIAYGQYRAQRMATTKAAVSLDGVGAAWPLNVHREADCARTACGPAIAAVANDLYAQRHEAQVSLCTVEVSDTLLADPAIGVPTVWPHRACRDRTWHTSLDTMDKIDTSVMKEMALIVGCTLLRFASLDVDDAAYVADLCVEQGMSTLREKQEGRGVRCVNRAVLTHELESELAAIERISDFAFADNAEAVRNTLDDIRCTYSELGNAFIDRSVLTTEDDSDEIIDESAYGPFSPDTVFARRLTGHLSLDPLSDEACRDFKGSPRWSSWCIAAFWWVNGERSLRDIYASLYGEFQVSNDVLSAYFGALKKHNYIHVV